MFQPPPVSAPPPVYTPPPGYHPSSPTDGPPTDRLPYGLAPNRPAANPTRSRPWWLAALLGLIVVAVLAPLLFFTVRNARDPSAGNGGVPDLSDLPIGGVPAGDLSEMEGADVAPDLDLRSQVLLYEDSFIDRSTDWYTGTDLDQGSSDYVDGGGYSLLSAERVGNRQAPFRSVDNAIAVTAQARPPDSAPSDVGYSVGCSLLTVGDLTDGFSIHLGHYRGSGFVFMTADSPDASGEYTVLAEGGSPDTPAEMTIVCDRVGTGPSVEVVGYADGVEVLRSSVLVHDRTARWHAYVGALSTPTEPVVFGLVQVRDPLVPAPEPFPVDVASSIQLGDYDFTTDDQGWDLEPTAADVVDGEGVRLRGDEDARLYEPGVQTGDRQIVAARLVHEPDSVATASAGVGCIDEMSEELPTAYAFRVAPDGVWTIERSDGQYPVPYTYTIGRGSTPTGPPAGPVTVRLACLLDASTLPGATNVRLVAWIDDEVVLDVVDAIHVSFAPDWWGTIELGPTYDVTVSSFELRELR